MTLAVTGGTGFVGTALVERAIAEGCELRALTRRAQPHRDGVEWIIGDLDDAPALARLLTGARAIIHVAGLTRAPDPAKFEVANVRGTLAVIEAALTAGVRRVILVSSLAAREPGLSAYGASKARAEQWVAASSLDWTAVRPPAVYGPGDRDMFELFRAASWGFVPVPAGGRASLIHVDDLARLLLALVPQRERTTSATFEPDDGTPGGWANDQMALAIGEAAGRRPRVLPLSRRMMSMAARVDQLLRRDRARLTCDSARYMSHPDWVVSEAARVPAEIWRPEIATRDGLRATADWYREQGWL